MSETAREPSLSGLLNQFEVIGGPEEFGPEGLAIAVALWRKSSKLNWMQTFQMTNTELMVQTGIATRKTLNVYRSKLIEAGIIAYKQPPRGSSKGIYSIKFELIKSPKAVTSGYRSEDKGQEVGQEVVTVGNHYGNNFSEVEPQVVTSGYHFSKAVTSGNHFSPYLKKVVTSGNTVLKDLSSSASSASASAAAAEKPELYESFYAAHKRVFGFECNPFQANKLGVYIDQDGLDEAVIIRAIERAAIAATGYRFNLITKILDDYFHSGVKTLEQAITWDAAFDAKKAAGSTRASPSQSKQQRELEELDHFIKEEQKSGQGRGRDISSYY